MKSMHIQIMKKSIILFLLSALLVPSFTFADGTNLEVAGWIPYWRDSEGIKDATKHLSSIDMVFPFAFTVTTKGELRDQAGLDDREWKRFVSQAQRKDVLVLPTVMWSDGASINSVLSDSSTRKKHIGEIVDMVKKGKYDGVDIDYEGKLAITIDYFSLFLKELKEKLGSKVLACTIEARTPPDSLYRDVPATITYANDYEAIGTYCDTVEIMAYDQQRADIKLNAERVGLPYMPVSDPDWVRKVLQLAVKDIPKEKIFLGISSYGYHYAVTVAPNWFKDYQRIGALNVPHILALAKEYKVTPTRNRAGEMGFTYVPKSSKLKLKSSLQIPKDTQKGDVVAQRALAYANKTGETVVIHMTSYSDAESMKQKIDLAEEFGIRGVAFFKIDGEEDQKVWKYFK